MNKTVLITGASSGIGRALALNLAARGCHLALTARRLEILHDVQEEIRQLHPESRVAVAALDVTDYEEVPSVIEGLANELGQLDIVVANAGVANGGNVGHGNFADDRKTIETNVLGAMATIDASVAYFRRQGQGQVVAIASVAACRGMPGSGAYCASKAALSTYMESVEAELYGSGIKCTTLFPGYIDTPINNMLKSRPFLVSVEEGAQQVADLIAKQVTRSTVPRLPWGVIGRLLRLAPTSLLAGQGSRT